MNEPVNLSLAEVHRLAVEVLEKNGLGSDHAHAIAKVITAGERDECYSHGVYRLIVSVNTLRQGKVNKTARPEVIDVAPAVVRVDANFGYSQLAFEMGAEYLAEKARKVGIAALAINNCFHFSALWPEVEHLASKGLVGLALTPSHSWVAPAGGTRPVFGTNPIAFAWPRPGGVPYVFDFATSAAARGEIELHRRSGKAIPLGWAVDENGAPTDNAESALAGAMLTFGQHKGSALSCMIELLAGPLIGDLLSSESQALDAGAGATPCHGELILALDPKVFLGGNVKANFERAEKLFQQITGQGARLPSQRRFDARIRSQEKGVFVPRKLFDDIRALIPLS
ncbi:Ldh family oxidoreductase [Herbaspirillum sp. RV1423]|uniref:Ldh family oxidoreductase n=1 Tax=Herbaspirillum sp. RV1423 TaxID=1443993 RepID=UPI0004AE3989|nr:Ldh family oxidoreductase [Herbaspirillum sp. RV1423]